MCLKINSVIYSHNKYAYIHIYMFMQDTYRRNELIRHRKTSLTKYIPLTLLQGFERVVQGLRVRGSWFACEWVLETEQNWNILTPNLWPSTLGLSRTSDAQLEVLGSTLLGAGFLYASYQHLLWTLTHQSLNGPFGLMWLFLPHLVSNCLHLLWHSHLDSNSTELYNGSTPTQSLKSHVWSSSSGNNCHAVHRSLSSRASVYECTMGIF